MCATCGCSDGDEVRLTDPRSGEVIILDHSRNHSHSHFHSHPPSPFQAHDHDRDHHHDHGRGRRNHHDHDHEKHDHEAVSDGARRGGHGEIISLEQEVLARNNQRAEQVRAWLAERSILALNLVSSPGAGKTTLLERTIRELGAGAVVSVIEGDQQTLNDARRIEAAGCRALQVNTGTACHLDASMIDRALTRLDPPEGSVVMIENVGNLVCPALFDLGERAKVVIVSVAEGDDKPIKYPHMFRASALMLLNKIDLLPHVNFDVERCIEYAWQVNPRLEILELSATRGDGLKGWLDWLREQSAHSLAGAPTP